MPAAPDSRLTVAQAIVNFLKNQWTERDGQRRRLIPAAFGIFGHGNVAGLGQALREYGGGLPFHQAKNEQSMVHAAIGYAKACNRLSTLACTASIGPGSTNMVTGAATATINHIPVLLLPSDVFASRRPGNVLQQVENATGPDLTVNDCFRPVSVHFDRIWRPDQTLHALPEAMRALTDPARAGAVTISLPQDVQGETLAVPARFLRERVWTIPRPMPEPAAIAQAADLLAGARRPVIIAGGGVRYAGAEAVLRRLADRFGIPVAETFAGKGVAGGTGLLLGGGGLTGTAAAAKLTAGADLVLCVGTRLSDFATASRSAFANPDVRFVSINVNPADAAKLGGLAVVADARSALEALEAALGERGWATGAAYRDEAAGEIRAWLDAYRTDIGHRQGHAMSQGEIIGHVNRAAGEGDVVVAAAGTPPGEIMKGWDTGAGSEVFLEFGYSCMGHEIPAGLGVALSGARDGKVFVVVGDGTYLLCNSELVTAVQERQPIVVVVIRNDGFQCIRDLQEASTGLGNFGNEFRLRGKTGALDGDYVVVDYAANARSMGCRAVHAATPEALDAALAEARESSEPFVIVVEADRRHTTIGAGHWWDVGVAEASEVAETRAAAGRTLAGRAKQVYLA
ncbi:MAG: 3D-(3,5/4)-trihydroxycyclohexane-1,2-dione acylhydrolase (decyclizing) [Azospirillaceae bacterium]